MYTYTSWPIKLSQRWIHFNIPSYKCTPREKHGVKKMANLIKILLFRTAGVVVQASFTHLSLTLDFLFALFTQKAKQDRFSAKT